MPSATLWPALGGWLAFDAKRTILHPLRAQLSAGQLDGSTPGLGEPQ